MSANADGVGAGICRMNDCGKDRAPENMAVLAPGTCCLFRLWFARICWSLGRRFPPPYCSSCGAAFYFKWYCDYFYCYWFSLFPSEQQPSGTCNFSRLPRIRMEITVDPYFYNNNETYTFTVFATNLNILRAIGGFGNTAYVQ